MELLAALVLLFGLAVWLDVRAERRERARLPRAWHSSDGRPFMPDPPPAEPEVRR